jgi:hypothetical protein
MRDLAHYELKVFSQNGEDGVLAEIIRRSGAPGTFFIEFGAGYGVENNCAVLADLLGWRGLFIDAADAEYAGLQHKYGPSRRVCVLQALITPESIDELLAANDVPAEPDVMSIDVDGGDYWIWQGMEKHRPRVVVIEYNGELTGRRRRLVQPPDKGPWDVTRYFGASIQALVALGERKGYRLVHCDLTGNNAFFVRDDLPGDYLPAHEVPLRSANLWLRGTRHDPSVQEPVYVEVS